jgi:hypothetical protein
MERQNRFKKDSEHEGFPLSNSFNAEAPRFIQTAEEIIDSRGVNLANTSFNKNSMI